MRFVVLFVLMCASPVTLINIKLRCTHSKMFSATSLHLTEYIWL
uniref:Uncharacterized protein n=1 Tax=Anguilla anguilla TaxID=7936 RepID=A0A0E9SR76_ANGAN